MPYMLVKIASADRGGMSYGAWSSKKGKEIVDKNMGAGADARRAGLAAHGKKVRLQRIASSPNIKLPAAKKAAPVGGKALSLVRKLAHA